jgi:hypothetical protein
VWVHSWEFSLTRLVRVHCCYALVFFSLRSALSLQSRLQDSILLIDFVSVGFVSLHQRRLNRSQFAFPVGFFFSCSVHLLASRAPASRSDLSCSSESGFVWVCGHVFVVITLLVISLCSQLVILQERELVQGSSVWFSAMERFTQLMAESLHSAL